MADKPAEAETGAIAIIGLACRFPGEASDPEKLWGMLKDENDAWSAPPNDRFNIKGWYHPDPNRQGSFHIRGAHFLKDDIAVFDAPFFSISTKEATSMDPQQRILLEVTYEALESAGIPLSVAEGSETSVFCGSFTRDYEQPCMRDPDTTPAYAATGTGIAIISNRVSHVFDLAGTSQTIDTGCSASLVCVHQACRSLLSGESDMSIAAGVGLIFSPNTLVPMAGLNILSPDGRCFTFDERANGYGRGEGIGAVVLKRVEDAVRDNDTIRGIIRGTRSNQDGRTQGITLPSKERQVANISGVYRNAGLGVDRTAFVECHGTGTQAGDFLELNAVSESLCRGRSPADPIIVSSVKPNIGHLEGSAGIAGLIKGLLVVEKGYIPKHFNFNKPNPRIDFEALKVKVPTELTPWPVEGLRRASVNSFGFGGTNAHAILDDAAHYLSERGMAGQHNTFLFPGDKLLTSQQTPSFPRTQLYVFSGYDEAALSRVLARQTEYIQAHKTTPDFAANLAYTLFSRRSKLDRRAFLVAQSPDELLRKLASDELTRAPTAPPTAPRGTPRIALVFSGQGAQWHAMGRELMDRSVFGASLSAADRHLRDGLGAPFSLRDELARDKETSRIGSGMLAQPATTAVQVALVDLLRACGVRAVGVVGHSSGEIAAAYAAGALGREDAWALAYHRGRCAAALEADPGLKGAMLAVPLAEAAARRFVDAAGGAEKVQVACVNGPANVTLAGDEDEIVKIQTAMAADKIAARRVNVRVAYHSRHMARVEADYRQAIREVKPRAGGGDAALAPRMYSSLYGRRVESAELTAEYWVRNLVQPVRFYEAVVALATDRSPLSPEPAASSTSAAPFLPPNHVLEVGPHRTWEPVLFQIWEKLAKGNVDVEALQLCAPLLYRGRDAAVTALTALGELWLRGYPVRLDEVTTSTLRSKPRHLVDCPTYPFDRTQRYWHESAVSITNRFREHGREDLIGAPLENCNTQYRAWRGWFRVAENPWLVDHEIQKAIVYPAGGMVAMALEAASQMADQHRIVDHFVISQLKITKPIMITTSAIGLEHEIRATATEEGTFDFTLSTQSGNSWTPHAQGVIEIHYMLHGQASEMAVRWRAEDERFRTQYRDALKKCHQQTFMPRQLYEALEVGGIAYGPTFRNLVELSKGDAGCCSTLKIPDTASVMPAGFEFPYISHPATIDSILQTVFGFGQDAMLPVSIGRIVVSANIPTMSGTLLKGLTCCKRLTSHEVAADVVMFDKDIHDRHVTITDMRFRSMPDTTDGVGFLPNNRYLCSRMEWLPDIDTLDPVSPQELLDFMSHKHPTIRILQMGGQSRDTKAMISSLSNGPSAPRFAKYVVSGMTDAEYAQLRNQCTSNIILDRLTSQPESSSVDKDEFDIILHKHNGNDISKDGSDFPQLLYGFGKPIRDEKWTAVDCRKAEKHDGRCTPSRAIVIMPHAASAEVRRLSEKIRHLFQQRKVRTGRMDLLECSDLKAGSLDDVLCISLLELDNPLLFSMADNQFAAVKALLTHARSLLWLTRGGQLAVEDPRSATCVGLARTLRSEDAKRVLVTLDLDFDELVDGKDITKAIFTALDLSLPTGGLDIPSQRRETEFVLRQGLLHIPRLVLASTLSSLIERGESRATRALQKEETDLFGRAVSLYNPSVHGTEGPFFTEVDLPTEVPPNGVRLSVVSTCLDPEDTRTLGGETDDPVGGDVYGTIMALGRLNRDGPFKVGDSAVLMSKGNIATDIVLDSTDGLMLLKPGTPRNNNSTAAATAFHGLINIGHLVPQDVLFILGAASPTGQMAAQVALPIVQKIFLGFETANQQALLLGMPGVQPEMLVDTQDAAAAAGVILQRSLGMGCSIVFNPTTATTVKMQACFRGLGQTRLIQPSKSLVNTMGVNVAFFDIWEEMAVPEKAKAIFAGVQELVSSGPYYSGIHQVRPYRYGHMREAFRDLAKDPYSGMYTLAPQAADKILLAKDLGPKFKADPDGLYLLVGGFGGLGRAIAIWLAGHGARHLVFFCRTKTDDANNFLQELEQLHGVVYADGVEVDILDEDALRAQFVSMEVNMLPKIKGVFQCAAVLEDSTFPNMTHHSWTKVTHPKMLGSWNLHRTLPDDLDFFILLSSSSGIIGNTGQAHYSAGNAFQDALAHHRCARGMHTVSLDVGLVLEAGMVARDPALLDTMKARGFFGIRLADFLALLREAVSPAARRTHLGMAPQIVAGVGTGGLTLQNRPSDPFWTRTPLFAALNTLDAPPGGLDAAGQRQPGGSLRERIRAAAGLGSGHNTVAVSDCARDVVLPALVGAVARRKGMKEADVDPARQLGAYGIDSMDAMFLLGWVSRETGVSLQTLEGVSIEELAGDVAGRAVGEARREVAGREEEEDGKVERGEEC